MWETDRIYGCACDRGYMGKCGRRFHCPTLVLCVRALTPSLPHRTLGLNFTPPPERPPPLLVLVCSFLYTSLSSEIQDTTVSIMNVPGGLILLHPKLKCAYSSSFACAKSRQWCMWPSWDRLPSPLSIEKNAIIIPINTN